MPFLFTLPTTSSVLLTDFFASVTHPSLPLTAATKRTVVKDALKKHKRLAASSRDGHLSTVQDALNAYIPYLLALSIASGYRDVGSDHVDLDFLKPLEAEWRLTLSHTVPGREAARPKVVGLHNEVAFVFSSLAAVSCLLGRAQIAKLYSTSVLSAEQRMNAIKAAMKYYIHAHNIYAYILSLPSLSASKDAPVDIQPSTISALASLALAEATLTAVLKDDPYATAVADDRNEQNNEWMYKAPTISKVRAVLLARISLAAAEHASQASALIAQSGNGRLDGDLIKYVDSLRRTARGKAARFLGINTELADQTGEALAWLKGARKELGFTNEAEDGKRKGFRGFKQSWQEKREDKKAEKGGDWGSDAGRYEELRIIEMLEAKWDKQNSTINVQAVPAFEPLLANMPSGRECHTPQPYQPPKLDRAALLQMRAPPSPSHLAFRGDEDDSGGEESRRPGDPVGAFPGAGLEYGGRAPSSTYY